jgi:hypothetical protein
MLEMKVPYLRGAVLATVVVLVSLLIGTGSAQGQTRGKFQTYLPVSVRQALFQQNPPLQDYVGIVAPYSSSDLYRVRGDGSDLHLLTNQAMGGWSSLSPDGRLLLFKQPLTGGEAPFHLMVIHLDSGTTYRVSERVFEREFFPVTWVADGSAVTVQVPRHPGSKEVDLVRIRTDGSGTVLWSEAITQDLGISPDHRWVAYTKPGTTDTARELWVRHASGAATLLTTITTPIAVLGHWQPDSRGLLIENSRQVASLEGELSPPLYEPSFRFEGWGAYGSALLLSQPAGGALRHLFTTSLTGAPPVPFTTLSQGVLDPAITPDGSIVLYSTYSEADPYTLSVYLHPLNSSLPRLLGTLTGTPDSSVSAYSPLLSPDQRHFFYTTSGCERSGCTTILNLTHLREAPPEPTTMKRGRGAWQVAYLPHSSRHALAQMTYQSDENENPVLMDTETHSVTPFPLSIAGFYTIVAWYYQPL